MAIDAVMHINSINTKNITDAVKRVEENKSIEAVINAGMDLLTSKDSISISEVYDKFYSAVGIHPFYINGQDLLNLYNMVNSRVVAIGKIGMDKNRTNYIEQRNYFIEQIKIANELGLPIIVLSGNSHREIREIFKTRKPEYGCVFQCFQPDMEMLDYIIENGYYVSFAGKITFLNAKKSLEVVAKVPDESYLVETSSPYISPEPYRKIHNSVANLNLIIKKIAEIRNCSYEDVENTTTNNAKKLYFKMK